MEPNLGPDHGTITFGIKFGDFELRQDSTRCHPPPFVAILH